MLYTVRYVKSNYFFPKKYDIFEEEGDGRKKKVGTYDKNNAPGSELWYRPHFVGGSTSRFLVNLNGEDLNDLVKAINLYDDEGNLIEAADVRNISDKFFSHDDLYFFLEKGVGTLNDEIPMHRFFLKCFEADPKFEFVSDEENPAMSAYVEYSVTRVGDEAASEVRKVNKSILAMELFANADFDKRVKILTAMGVNMIDPDPEQVKTTLYIKITEDANNINRIYGISNIDAFIQLAKGGDDELNKRSLINKAIKLRVIRKTKDSGYVYDDIKLGNTIKSVNKFFENPDNDDIAAKIMIDVKNSLKDASLPVR